MAKEVDLFWRSRLLKCFAVTFGPFHLLGFCSPFNILWATLAWIVCALIAAGLSAGAGEGSVNFLYGLGPSKLSPQGRFAGELDKIRFSKRQKEFDRALSQVNEVLAVEPDFPEALFLKAQILWEGFGNLAAAQRYLKKVLGLVRDNEPLQRWAVVYDEQVIGMKQGL